MNKIQLKTRFIILFAGIIAISLISYATWSNYTQQKQAINEMKEKAYALSQQMNAVWEFMSIHQDRINYDADGSYNFKGLHCSLVGKSIGKLFSYKTEYITRYVNHNPRNPDDIPDAFENAALNVFASNPAVVEVYELTEFENDAAFRYVAPMYIETSCLECHGEPAGELDVTGFRREGWSIGDLAGALSIVMPVDTYMTHKTNNIHQEVAFFSVLIITFILIIYFVTTSLVTKPLTRLKAITEEIRSGNLNADVNADDISAQGEIRDLSVHFNAMIKELRAVYNDLENKVELRTQDLARANDILETQQGQLEKINQQLLNDNQYKSDFMAIMSHELRTPLTSTIACTDVLEKTLTGDNPRQKKMLGEIKNNSSILYSLINNILDMARIEAGKTELLIEPVDFVDVINTVRSMIAPLADKKVINIQTKVDKDVPVIMGDREKLRRIVENLMSNAVKFTRSGGEVRVDISYLPDTDRVVITVADNGLGIKKEEQNLIFQKFVQGDSSIHRPHSGSGLGLALAKELTELHGGTIAVESEVGTGSVFTVTIPVNTEEKR